MNSRALESRRRELEEKERLLQEERARLRQELGQEALPPEPETFTPSLPVWRHEREEPFLHSREEPPLAVKRTLARERQRQRALFFLCAAVLLVVGGLTLWLAWALHAL